MAATFEELDFQQTPMGELILRRRLVPTLENREVFEVKLGEEYLMSSMFHAAEIALAKLGLTELGAGEIDAVVGGLGLGYTAVAALASANVRSLLVIEALEAVIGWHRRGLVPPGPGLSGDPRCRFLHGDFFALARAAAGFEAGRRFHAVLLDIDHAPNLLLHPRHAGFYTPDGLRAFARHLHPDGVFAMWSNDPPDPAFAQVLEKVFVSVRAEVVAFPNPLLGRDSSNTVYLARAAAAG
jgi:spermidine synthase